MALKSTVFMALVALVEVCFGQGDAAFGTKRSIDFFAEEITLAVTKTTSTVYGTYFFRNYTGLGGTFPVMFPFHADSLTLYPDRIKSYVVDGVDTTKLDIRKLPDRNAISLGIPIKPNEVTAWHLEYSQKILGPQATYIITSTQAWGEPLEEATYRFIVPADFDSVTVWPEADSMKKYDNYIEYISRKTDFMPDRDMVIRWKRK